jgi:hypothetical protein
MSKTRLDIEKIRSNWAEKKRQQRSNPKVLEGIVMQAVNISEDACK